MKGSWSSGRTVSFVCFNLPSSYSLLSDQWQPLEKQKQNPTFPVLYGAKTGLNHFYISFPRNSHYYLIYLRKDFPGGSEGKESACNAEDLSSIPEKRSPLEKVMATHSSILAWRIPWKEQTGGLQSMGSQRVAHDWATNAFTFCLR